MSVATKKGASGLPSGSTMNHKPPAQSNGTGPPSIYPIETQDDENMNEVIDEQLEIFVTLPNGSTKTCVFDHRTPMIDLLVNIAAGSRLNPAGHQVVLFSEESEKPLDYKANQTIGSLPGRRVKIVPKKSESERRNSKNVNVKPFEETKRFTVNYANGQKKLLRIPYTLRLFDLFETICHEKQLNPARYMLQHPKDPSIEIDMSGTVADLKASEVNVVLAMDETQSLPDLSRTQGSPGLSLPQKDVPKEKKKKGFLSFLKKDKRHKKYVREVKKIEEEPPRRSASTSEAPPNQVTRTQRPMTMIDSTDSKHSAMPVQPNNIPAKSGGKKRPAPLPPQQKGGISESPVKIEPAKLTIDPHAHKLHSRNSSDSSGYHEITMSGAESPEGYSGPGAYKPSVDVDSLEGVNSLSGCDSGISHAPGANIENDAAYSQTLPHKKTADSFATKPKRSNSLEDSNRSKSGAVPGKKKKAPAPPKPSDKGAVRETLPPISSSPVPQLILEEHKPDPDDKLTPDEPSAQPQDQIDGLEDSAIAGLDDIINDNMVMVEDGSVKSEEFSEIPKSQRPCEFVAPPPPDEPPPSDSDTASLTDMYGVKVKDTCDVSVEINEDSSLTNSPHNPHYRADSRISRASVDTIEDISNSFALTIALGEEAYIPKVDDYTFDGRHYPDEDTYYAGDDESPDRYESEMAAFNDKMSKLNLPNDDDNDITRVNSRDDHNQDTDSRRHENLFESSPRSIESGRASTDIEVSEIFTKSDIDTKPLKFRDDFYDDDDADSDRGKRRDGDSVNASDDEEDEEIVVDEVVVVDVPIETSRYSENRFSNVNIDRRMDRNRVEPEKPKEEENRPKEEFVITLSDLRNVNYTVPKPEKKTYSKPQTFNTSSSNDSYGGNVSLLSLVHDGPNESTPVKDNVNNRRSELNFSPRSESESETFLEEKSISQIAHPARMSSSKSLDLTASSPSYVTSSKSFDLTPSSPKHTSSASINLSFDQRNAMVEKELRNVLEKRKTFVDEHGDNSQLDDKLLKRDSMTNVYTSPPSPHMQLQQQMAMWQQQLLENQKLLQEHNVGPDQMQANLRIQQQLMEQIQQCMEALTEQSLSPDSPKLADSRLTPTQSAPQMASAPAAPTPPPFLAKTVKPVKAPSNKHKDDPRFQPKLDPREELMFAIRGFSKGNQLRKVPLVEADWHDAPTT